MPSYYRSQNSADMHPSVIHVSNLHCSSCVTTIHSLLRDTCPVVEVSIVLQTVTAYHREDVSEIDIIHLLEQEGFDVVSHVTGHHAQNAKHLEHCALCKEQTTHVPRPVKVILSIGGMTCSACSNSVSLALAETPGVRDITVSLLDNSASAIAEHEGLLDSLQEAVEACGFEATVISVHPANPEHKPDAASDSRSVSFRVDGMFCSKCPQNVILALESLSDQIQITRPLTFADPIVTISYIPNPPSLTIRSILSAIRGVSSAYNVIVWHPPTVEERSRILQRREQRNYIIRLAFTVVVAIPTFVIGIVYMTLVDANNPTRVYLMHPIAGDASRSEIALFILATLVYLGPANVFHRRSMKEIYALWRPGSKVPIWKRFLKFGSMNLLVSSGVSVAYFSSIALLILAATRPANEDGMGDSQTYFDSVVFLTMFLLAGRYLEAFSKAKTADALTALASLRPEWALLVSKQPASIVHNSRDLEKASPGEEAASLSSSLSTKIEKIPIDLLEVGDIVRILAGASPPADGMIVPGEHGTFDESSMTGESRPVKKSAGDQVFLGTINLGDVVHMAVTNVGGSTMLDNIVKVVREGQTRRAPMERVADLVTGYFVPVVTLLAILTWLIWLGLGLSGRLPSDYLDNSIGGWSLWSLEFAIAVFVVACPCGIGLAAPTALLVGSGLAAKFGILARGGGEAFQEMSLVDTVVFDKTGTLTEGIEPRVTNVTFQSDHVWSHADQLGIAAELESASSHVIATAIKQYCELSGSQRHQGSKFEEVSGRGLRARFDDLNVTAIIGNAAWMEEHSVVSPSESGTRLWHSEGKSVVFMAIRDDSQGDSGKFLVSTCFAISDAIRPESAAVIRLLQTHGLRTWILSGDDVKTVSAVAKTVGIPEENVIGGVLPHEKAAKIQSLQGHLHGAKRSVVCYIGDGINDAPALAVADVGVAIGSGSDVAISSASFVLLSSSLKSVIVLRSLSQAIIRRVKMNFAWALVYNLVMLPIAAGVIYPARQYRLSPVWASLAMALSSISVVCSSLLLRLYKPPKVANN